MGTRELFLVLGAVVLFSITSLSANRALLNYKESVWSNETEAAALSLAQRYIEEAKTKAFDLATVGGAPTGLPGNFTSPWGLGPAYNETYPNFNDVDDFNGFTQTVSTPRGDFTVSIVVGYVSDTNPNTIITSPTFYKNMTVTVSNPLLLKNAISISTVFGYWGEAP